MGKREEAKANQYFELDYIKLNEGKKKIRQQASSKDTFTYPSYSPVLDQRWRALITNWYNSKNINSELKRILELIIQACAEQNLMAEQREIYYVIRGKYPKLTVQGTPWKDLYNTFLNNYINKVQLAIRIPMQSFGVEAGSRGSVAGEGYLLLENGIRVPLNAEPKLRFELTRDGVRYYGHAKKHIHYEKEAGFARLIAGDIAKMIEAIFSTSQGYSSEAASKFIRDSEERNIATYCLHDADPHGLQMQMMYGVASKNNCYMTDRFYPHKVTYLGLVPIVAREIGLPPEEVADTDRKIIPNLRALLQERGEFLQDVDIIDKSNEKWEYQALNALHERAPQVYLVEALRARNDEIKYVPPASEIKEAVKSSITSDVHNLVESEVSRFTDRFYQTNIKPQLVEQLKDKLESDISEFDKKMFEELPKIDTISDEDVREAVKLKLVENPRQYWDSAQYQVMRDMLRQKFNVEADIEWGTSVKEANADKSLAIGNLVIPEQPLTKTNIVDSIQKRIITTKPARDKVVNLIRQALERAFGKPNEEW